VDKRRSLTPYKGLPNVKGRRGGARLTVSDRVTFRGLGEAAGVQREGWALNVSRGGLRAILDETTGKVELGQEYEVTITVADAPDGKAPGPRKGRIVWLQEEPDGFVVGVQYVTASGRLAAVDPGTSPIDAPNPAAIKPAPKKSG
jgi:hypothetical protein